jgi:hypothetical protein
MAAESHTEIYGTVDRFEADQAVIVLSTKQELVVPATSLPHGVKAGERLVLHFSRNSEGTALDERIAKKLLQEILNPPTNTTPIASSADART